LGVLQKEGVVENLGVGARVEDDEFWHDGNDLQDWVVDKIQEAGDNLAKTVRPAAGHIMGAEMHG
jgi:hypothetical protein